MWREHQQEQIVHLYQNTVGGFLLFYSVIDFLVFFSLVCTAARRNHLRLLAVIPMFDHLHLLIEARSRESVAPFVDVYTSGYSKALNHSLGSSGAVSNPGFGCAIKSGEKAIRTACSYAYNNPGEKGLCHRAEAYRWTFLAYAQSANPFSEKIVLSRASAPFRRALKMIDYWRNAGLPLRHQWLEPLFLPLQKKEREQLTDYIITAYNALDYQRLISFYGDHTKMCLSFFSNQGSEYDIRESFIPGSHRQYLEIASFLRKICHYANVKDALRLPEQERRTLADNVISGTRIPPRFVYKYLRLVEDKPLDIKH
ncbi:MAG: hypothetical protein IJV01_03125 [Bacteroidales bacterium]|nr:hypothetical protein [Bacteroidales bacterium]